MTMTKYEVDKPFPGPIPSQEGATMELWEGGLVVLIQMPDIHREERQAFKKSFKRYSYLETSTSVAIALWVFDFPKPHGPIDCSFNARIANPEYIRTFLEPENGQVKNALQLFLLDRNILKGIKLVGLELEAVKLFHATIRKQLAMDYAQADYDRYLNSIYQYTTDELFKMGKQFKK